MYTHYPSGQTLSGSETRNLNRAYPGVADGNLTERMCYAITEMIKENKIDMTVDLHESSPEYPTINAMVAHDRAMSLASAVTLDMALDGVDISLEQSPTTLHGLMHRGAGRLHSHRRRLGGYPGHSDGDRQPSHGTAPRRKHRGTGAHRQGPIL